MKTSFLVLLTLAAAPVTMADDHEIIEEALKATPPGFTDLVPRQSILRAFPREASSVTFKPDVSRLTPSDIQTLITELEALRKENAELKRKLSDLQKASE